MHVKNFLLDRIFLLNQNEERSMMMSPGLSIKIYNKSPKINKLKIISNSVQLFDF